MAFDSVFQGPPEDVAAPGTAQSPSLGVDVSNRELYISSGQGWEPIEAPSTPAGSNGELQYNDGGVSTGTPGGTTNGTHFALGNGSVIDTAYPIAPDGEFSAPRSAIAVFEEQNYTNPLLENGVYVEVDLNPSAPVAAGSAAIGNYVYMVAVDGPNWNASDNFLVGGWFSTLLTVNAPNVSPDGNGAVFGVYVSGSANVQHAHGAYFDAFNLAEATVDNLVGAEIALQNASDGTVTQAEGVLVNFYGNGAGGTTTSFNAFHVNAPTNNGDTITTLTGLRIEEIAVAGVGTAYPIFSASAALSVFEGPLSFPYVQAQTVYSLAGTPLPSAVTAGMGARAFVSDSTSAAVGSFVALYLGGGAEHVPVYSDGSIWCLG